MEILEIAKAQSTEGLSDCIMISNGLKAELGAVNRETQSVYLRYRTMAEELGTTEKKFREADKLVKESVAQEKALANIVEDLEKDGSTEEAQDLEDVIEELQDINIERKQNKYGRNHTSIKSK